jgi:hypothetical protein
MELFEVMSTAGDAAAHAGPRARFRHPTNPVDGPLCAERRQPSELELRGGARSGQASSTRPALPRGVARAGEASVLRGRGEGAARQPGGQTAGLGDTSFGAPRRSARADLGLYRARPGRQSDADDRSVDLSCRAEPHACGARARHRHLPHDHSQVPRCAGQGVARHSGAGRDRCADSPRISAGHVARPARKPVHEVAYADAWGQALA